MFGLFLLFLDISLFLVWGSYYIYLLSTHDVTLLPYLSSHFAFTVHTIATLRLINIVESMGSNLKGPPMFFWNVATFSFAVVYDGFNLGYIIVFLSQGNGVAYGWELGLSIAFFSMSVIIWFWYISSTVPLIMTKKVAVRQKV
jgi:hypothetical protein